MSTVMRFKDYQLSLMATALLSLLAGCAQLPASSPSQPSKSLQAIDTIVVIYAENHSFDNIYGLFPGANGVANATPQQKLQLDHDGQPLRELVVFGPDGKPDPKYPRLPNGPFRIDAPPVSRSPNEVQMSPTHDYFYQPEQINGGQNNHYAAMSSVGGWVMGHYDGSQFKLWRWAQEYTLADNFFQGAFGGSFLNHQWLICACTPEFKSAPAGMRVVLDELGHLKKKPGSASANDGRASFYTPNAQVTPDGWAVNTSQPPYQPSAVPPASGGPMELADARVGADTGRPIPPQTAKTVGDTLSAKGVTWVWYSGGWNAALADGMQPADIKRKVIYQNAPESPNFQPHHQPFNYFSRYAPGTSERAEHIKDGADFEAAISAGTLPQVAFYKPPGRLTQHPAYTDMVSGDLHIAGLLDKLKASPQWPHMLVVVTYDENGGYWDHVPPPTGPGSGDRWGPGARIPALLIGPSVKRGFVDSSQYDTTSIIKLLTKRFGLEPLPGVRANVGDLSAALQ